MLWSDDRHEGPPEDMRRAQTMLRRAMVLIAFAAAVVMALAAWRA
ncbi:morphogenic membrane protein MmpB [Streptomyces polygonati]|uniref:Morphogenic membrane protein MmpB n=1 Tax=Streptomyces polygonati TaxID=1617087 RepID=A0ABV8HPI3_9ACTN